jgi:hypothetical protein
LTIARTAWTGLKFARLPSVILDTKERLYLRSPGIEETLLPESQGQTFHYRYRRLRLLIHGRDRMFLVPDTWSASNSTMIVAMDGSVRVHSSSRTSAPEALLRTAPTRSARSARRPVFAAELGGGEVGELNLRGVDGRGGVDRLSAAATFCDLGRTRTASPRGSGAPCGFAPWIEARWASTASGNRSTCRSRR